MTDEREWKWKVGILHGIGECMWQECAGKIQKVSRFIAQGGQIGMVKGMVGGLLIGVQEITADGLVAFSVGATDEQQKNANSLWSILVRPTNGGGAPVFKLDK